MISFRELLWRLKETGSEGLRRVGLILICVLLVSCASRDAYRKVRIVDSNGTPIKGVYQVPSPYSYYGRVSNKDGFMHVPRYRDDGGGFFSLSRKGYRTLWVDLGEGGESMNCDSVIVMERESRSSEDVVADDAAMAKKMMEKYQRRLNPD